MKIKNLPAMPLTPFHLGPGLFLGFLTLRFLNLWAILLGSVLPDIEPLILIFVKRCYYCATHGFWHSVLGAVLGSFILSLLLWKFRGKLNQISLKFGIFQSFSFKNLYFSSLLAWLIHVLFDSLTHYDVFPFWPSSFNPILIGAKIYWPLTSILAVLGIISLILFFYRYARHKYHKRFPE